MADEVIDPDDKEVEDWLTEQQSRECYYCFREQAEGHEPNCPRKAGHDSPQMDEFEAGHTDALQKKEPQSSGTPYEWGYQRGSAELEKLGRKLPTKLEA